jgi:hypothetical protein
MKPSESSTFTDTRSYGYGVGSISHISESPVVHQDELPLDNANIWTGVLLNIRH